MLACSRQGLVTGPAFTAVYVASSIPLSWVADRYNRVHVLMGGLAAWTLVTFGLFFVEEFYQVMLCSTGRAEVLNADRSFFSFA